MIGKIIRHLRTKFFTLLCKGSAKQVGKDVHINYMCKFSRNTVIGNNCHFNGVKIAGGHPAVPFKYRDKDHYDRLKAEGKYV